MTLSWWEPSYQSVEVVEVVEEGLEARTPLRTERRTESCP